MSCHKLTELSFEFTSLVRDQVTHGTCPMYPNHLKYPAFWTALESKCWISWQDQQFSDTQTLARLSPRAQGETKIEFGVCFGALFSAQRSHLSSIAA